MAPSQRDKSRLGSSGVGQGLVDTASVLGILSGSQDVVCQPGLHEMVASTWNNFVLFSVT